jgi:hypothetical protein
LTAGIGVGTFGIIDKIAGILVEPEVGQALLPVLPATTVI